MTVPPEELQQSLADAETNVAKYLEWFGLDKLAEAVPAQTDYALGTVLFIVSAYIFGNWLFRRHKSWWIWFRYKLSKWATSKPACIQLDPAFSGKAAGSMKIQVTFLPKSSRNPLKRLWRKIKK